MSSSYLIRIGAGSKYAQIARRGRYAAIGWEELGDLSGIGSLASIKNTLKAASYDYSDQQLAAQAGQLNRFVLEMKPGDLILAPFEKGKYMAGIAGDYFFEANPQDGCPYSQRRKVDWQKQLLDKEDMTTSLSYALGGSLSVFSLDKYGEELKALIAGKEFTPADQPQTIRGRVLAGLFELDGKGFESFLGHLLEVIGFSAEVTKYAGDKGIDVIGTLDAEGVADINLRVQAKRLRSDIDGDRVAALRGRLEQGQLGCLITLSKFRKSAMEEAEGANRIPIKLVDGDDLAGIVLKNYDNIDEEYKKLFGIKRKPNYKIEDQFEPVDSEGVEEQVSEEASEHGEAPAWDTIVCPAKEDGFQSAFIENKAWWAIRIWQQKIPYIKYIAMYQVAPLSQITHYGVVDRIEPFEDSGKYIVYLKGDPIKLKNPVGIGEKRNIQPQSSKYAKFEDILTAQSLDDVWG